MPSSSGRPAQLLVVDDDETLLRLIAVSLQRAGFVVHTAANGVEAIAVASRESIDLLITDILMPEMEGIELIGRLRQSTPQLRVIAMSGGGTIGAEHCLKLASSLKAAGVLEKPFPINALVSMVRDLASPQP